MHHLFGIFYNCELIGNVSLGPIEQFHNRAEITYVIGSKKHWGKGIATYAVGKFCETAKRDFNFEKVFAGCAHLNEGSKHVLQKNNFTLEGVSRKQLLYNGIWMDQLDYGRILTA